MANHDSQVAPHDSRITNHDVAISVRGLGKSYRMYPTPKERLKELLHPFGRKFHKEFWALRDVSFEVKRGETVGIIGKNGSGKSTLLQAICGILQPTEGAVSVNGRISALLELGAGFNPEFTGRDNVYMNGAIQGITREEMDERFPSIAAFADIGDFIEQPVKTYSSGMFVRLAFACAVSVDPDILVVDEALAVGDRHFQVKCTKKMRSLIERGITLLFVSHDSYTVKNICRQAIWLDGGKTRSAGDAVDVVDRYNDFMNGLSSSKRPEKAAGSPAAPETGSSGALSELKSVRLVDNEGRDISELSVFDDMNVVVDYEVHEDIGPLIIGIAIFDNSDNYIFGINTQLLNREVASWKGAHKMDVIYPRLRLLPGTYYLNVGLFYKESKAITLDFRKQMKSFYVRSSMFAAEGLVYLDTEWKQGR